MKNIFNHLKNISLLQYSVYLFLIGYLPIIFLGYFIQDDFGIINFYNYDISKSIEWMCGVNSNRPLSCVYFGLVTRLWPIYQIYFLFIFFTYLIFVLVVLKIFDFLIYDVNIKKIFITFLFFPFFSYTILYSPAMQGIGALSLLLWALSLLFLKKYIIEKNILFFFLNYFFIFIMFLTYESATPLLGMSIFFPLLFRKTKVFFINLLIIFSIMIFIFYLQKFVFAEIFNIDLSRIKVSILDYKKIFLLMLVNCALTINILFHSLEIFIKSIIYNIKNFNILFFLHIFLLFSFIFFSFSKIKKLTIKINNKKNNYHSLILILMVLSVLFLNILMHALADTGIEFIRYNNRALTSLSFLMAFFSLISFSLFSKVNLKKVILANLIIFFIFANNFFLFQHNLIKERFVIKNIIQKEYGSKITQFYPNKKNIIFISLKDKYLMRALLSYGSYDSINIYSESGYHFWMKKPIYITMSEDKFCNKNYYNQYISKAYIENDDYKLNFYKNDEFFTNLDKSSLEQLFSNNYDCKVVSNKISKNLKKDIYLDGRFKSIFLSTLVNLYSKIK